MPGNVMAGAWEEDRRQEAKKKGNFYLLKIEF